MALVDSINTARQRGASDDQILRQIEASNPNYKTNIDIARSRGAKATMIIDDIIAKKSAVKEPSGLESFQKGLTGGKGVVEGTVDLAKESIIGGLKTLDPRETFKKAKEVAAPISELMTEGKKKETEDINAGLAQSILSSFNRGSITKEKAVELLNGLPDTETKGNESLINAFIKGGELALDVATKTEMVKDLVGAIPKVVSSMKEAPVMKATEKVTGPLTKAEKIEAASRGKVTSPGILTTSKVKPDETTLKNVKDLVDRKVLEPNGTLNKNLLNVKSEIKKISENEVVPLLNRHQQGFNSAQFLSNMEKAKTAKPIPFATNDGEAFYDRAITTAKKIIDQNPKNAEGLWKSRQQFDDVIDDVMPKAWESPDAGGMKTAVTTIRSEMNGMIKELVKDDAKNFESSMEKMSVLYDFKSGLSENLAKGIGENLLVKWIETLPVLRHVKHIFFR